MDEKIQVLEAVLDKGEAREQSSQQNERGHFSVSSKGRLALKRGYSSPWASHLSQPWPGPAPKEKIPRREPQVQRPCGWECGQCDGAERARRSIGDENGIVKLVRADHRGP